ncbi:hypothetical protein GCM10028864_54760 [Microlunatus parietis]
MTALPTTEVYGAAGDFLIACVREVYGSGWQPAELVRQARLNGDASTGDLCRWAMAAERAEPGLAGADPRWARQFEETVPLLDSADRWVEHWARWRRFPDPDNVELLVRLVGILYQTPPIPLLILPPAGIPTRTRVIGMEQAAASPILIKVRGLLAKAESTEHEAEAAAFTAKAHELMTRHAIDLATVQQAEHGDPGRPGVIRIPVDPPYPDAKGLLLQTVAEQTRCKTMYFDDLRMSSVVGYPTDLEAVELLFTSLLVQVQHALAQASAGAPPGSRPRSVGFRSAFLLGFTGRIRERLAEVNRLAYADDAAGTFLPVLRSQEERIDAFIEAEFGRRVHAVPGPRWLRLARLPARRAGRRRRATHGRRRPKLMGGRSIR